MKKTLVISAVLVVLGILLVLGSFAIRGFDTTKLLYVTYVEYTYTPKDEFTNISVTGVNCSIYINLSKDNTCTVHCNVDDRIEPTFEVKNGELCVRLDDQIKWWQGTGLQGENTVNISLPEKDYNALKAKTVTGHVVLHNASFSDILLTTTTGDIRAFSLSCKNFSAKLTTGDMLFNDVLTETMSLKATTGDIKLSSCDGNQMDIRNTTGDVKGTLRTGKQFTAHATTGDVRVPSDSGSGTCNIKTTTGNIEITVE